MIIAFLFLIKDLIVVESLETESVYSPSLVSESREISDNCLLWATAARHDVIPGVLQE